MLLRFLFTLVDFPRGDLSLYPVHWLPWLRISGSEWLFRGGEDASLSAAESWGILQDMQERTYHVRRHMQDAKVT